MLRGQLLSSNIALNTSCELLRSLRYLWPPLTFSTSTDHRNSVLWNPRTSIRKGEAHKLKPTSSNLPPSCLVPRLAYAPPLLPLSLEFVGGTNSDTPYDYLICFHLWFQLLTVLVPIYLLIQYALGIQSHTSPSLLITLHKLHLSLLVSMPDPLSITPYILL